jgi:hypothetical protein
MRFKKGEGLGVYKVYHHGEYMGEVRKEGVGWKRQDMSWIYRTRQEAAWGLIQDSRNEEIMKLKSELENLGRIMEAQNVTVDIRMMVERRADSIMEEIDYLESLIG